MTDHDDALRPPRPLRLRSTAPLSWRSGHDLLLGAVRRVTDRGVPVSLVVAPHEAGDQDGEDQIRFDLVDLGLESVVELRTEGRPAPAADLFVLPAVRGNWHPQLEAALTAGLPLVVSARVAGGAPELVGPDVAVIVADRDIDALAGAIGDLHVDAARRHALTTATRRRRHRGSGT